MIIQLLEKTIGGEMVMGKPIVINEIEKGYLYESDFVFKIPLTEKQIHIIFDIIKKHYIAD